MKILTTKSNLIFKSKEEKEFEKTLKKDIGKSKTVRDLNMRYVQGIKEIDESGKFKDSLTLMLHIYQHENGMSFKIENTGIMSWIVAFFNNEVLKVYFVDGEEIAYQKSVVGRSVAGALIAGPIGSVVGAISGLGEVKRQEAFMVMETDECKIIFKCAAGTKETLEKEFKNIFGDKVITSEEIKRQQEQELLNNI